jgi:hypothetical protein
VPSTIPDDGGARREDALMDLHVMTALDDILEKLASVDTRLASIENRLIAIEVNIDLLVADAKAVNVVKATVTPIPRAAASGE